MSDNKNNINPHYDSVWETYWHLKHKTGHRVSPRWERPDSSRRIHADEEEKEKNSPSTSVPHFTPGGEERDYRFVPATHNPHSSAIRPHTRFERRINPEDKVLVRDTLVKDMIDDSKMRELNRLRDRYQRELQSYKYS